MTHSSKNENKKSADAGISKKNKAKNKKEAQLVIRLDTATRDKFVEACQAIDTTASRELRGFIKKFLRRYDNGEFDD